MRFFLTFLSLFISISIAISSPSQNLQNYTENLIRTMKSRSKNPTAMDSLIRFVNRECLMRELSAREINDEHLNEVDEEKFFSRVIAVSSLRCNDFSDEKLKRMFETAKLVLRSDENRENLECFKFEAKKFDETFEFNEDLVSHSVDECDKIIEKLHDGHVKPKHDAKMKMLKELNVLSCEFTTKAMTVILKTAIAANEHESFDDSEIERNFREYFKELHQQLIGCIEKEILN